MWAPQIKAEIDRLDKKAIHKDITILNTYLPTNRALKYMKIKLVVLKGETDKTKIIIKDFKTLLLVIDRTSGQ